MGSARSLSKIGAPDQQDEAWETTPLHFAAGTGDVDGLQACLQPGTLEMYDINQADQHGRTPLVYTILSDQLACTQMLLGAGAAINGADADGRTALHWAAFHGKHTILRFLLENGADATIKDVEGRGPLHLSTGADSSRCAKQLISALPRGAVDDPDNESMTAAHWCAFHDHVKHLGLLLKQGASLAVQDNEGKVPLHWTSNNATLKTAQKILSVEPRSLNAVDGEGRTPLHLAVADNNVDMVNFLTSLEECAVSLPDAMHRTPLHWAAVLGCTEIANILVHRGADLGAPDDNGATALHYAAQHESPDTLVMFLQVPGVHDVADGEGRTALMWAAGKGNFDALSLMAQARFDLNAVDRNGGTALHAAAFSGSLECTHALLQYSAGLDVLDVGQHTPLFRACEMGHSELVVMLIQAGARTGEWRPPQPSATCMAHNTHTRGHGLRCPLASRDTVECLTANPLSRHNPRPCGRGRPLLAALVCPRGLRLHLPAAHPELRPGARRCGLRGSHASAVRRFPGQRQLHAGAPRQQLPGQPSRQRGYHRRPLGSGLGQPRRRPATRGARGTAEPDGSRRGKVDAVGLRVHWRWRVATRGYCGVPRRQRRHLQSRNQRNGRHKHPSVVSRLQGAKDDVGEEEAGGAQVHGQVAFQLSRGHHGTAEPGDVRPGTPKVCSAENTRNSIQG